VKFKLEAMIMHSGQGAGSGHYTTIGLREREEVEMVSEEEQRTRKRQWLESNDGSVGVARDLVQRSFRQAYYLAYVKVDDNE
jgi:hypothetical protein